LNRPQTRRPTRWVAALSLALGLAACLGVYELSARSRTNSVDPPIPVSEPLERATPAPDGAPNQASAAPGPRFIEAPGPAPAGMVWIPGGTFVMGDEHGQPDEVPAHEVTLDGFWMDRTEVTNAQFQAFVDATGYVTVAERTPQREDFRGQVPDVAAIPAENLVAGSICFNEKFDRRSLTKDHPLWPYQVWSYVKGANWRHPEGPGSNVEGRLQHPVVHVAWDDAVAYGKWAGKRLPTEAEWEYAARGGLAGAVYPWGNELDRSGKWLLNIWQGEFPETNEVRDGFKGTAAVGSFPANGYGLFDMSGNVWEWCHDLYRPDYYRYSPQRNPPGPNDSFDPLEPGYVKRVQRGGSFLCSDNYCRGYRVAARMKGTPDSGTFHAGFRCVRSPADTAK
jgi:formylglycine-generating enzyme required for sulfatase activity